VGTACLFLAGKVEETPKPLKEVVRVCYLVQHKQEYESAIRHIQQKVRLPLCFALDCTPARFEVALTIHPHSIAQDNLEEQKEKVLQAERVLLHTLGFDFNVSHPYKPLLSVAKQVNQMEQVLEEQSRSLTQVAWNFANDR
jgi:cyclin T|tara:strand:- start:402 stop:824 length:423 start_codon:yes stop_codon:yes gene_type:complete